MRISFFDSYGDSGIHVVVAYILKSYKVRFTNYKLKNLIDFHVNNPSISTIKDVLLEYGLQTVALRKGKYLFDDYQTPFISLLKEDNEFESTFTVVTSIDNGIVEYLDIVKRRVEVIKSEDFQRIGGDVVILIDDSNKKDEYSFEVNRKVETKNLLLMLSPILSMILIMFYNLAFRNEYSEAGVIQKTIYLFSLIAGSTICGFLFWHEIDTENPFFKRLCGQTSVAKTNCGEVLTSTDSKFLNISWSIWGLSYFLTLLVAHALIFDSRTTMLCAIASIAISPYILYSVYYQYRVIKKWCSLCLLTQFIIGVNLLIAISLIYHFNSEFDWQILCTVSLFGIIVLSASEFAKIVMMKAKRGRLVEKKWLKLRYKDPVFKALLKVQNEVTQSAENLGILIGNPNATIEILKVCNPFCNPCGAAHAEINRLLMLNKSLKLRLIFNATGRINDRSTVPVLHFLAIEEQLGAEVVHDAVNDWFSSTIKNYEELVNKYPVNLNVEKHINHVTMMNNWCHNMGVKATPSFFINGRLLPKEYNYEDFRSLF